MPGGTRWRVALLATVICIAAAGGPTVAVVGAGPGSGQPGGEPPEEAADASAHSAEEHGETHEGANPHDEERPASHEPGDAAGHEHGRAAAADPPGPDEHAAVGDESEDVGDGGDEAVPDESEGGTDGDGGGQPTDDEPSGGQSSGDGPAEETTGGADGPATPDPPTESAESSGSPNEDGSGAWNGTVPDDGPTGESDRLEDPRLARWSRVGHDGRALDVSARIGAAEADRSWSGWLHGPSTNAGGALALGIEDRRSGAVAGPAVRDDLGPVSPLAITGVAAAFEQVLALLRRLLLGGAGVVLTAGTLAVGVWHRTAD